LTATLEIPAQVEGMSRIAVRLESTNGGYFSYNWFTNVSRGSDSNPTATPAPSKVGTFSVQSVVKDSSVTIKTANFPAGKTYNVLMGAMGTRAVNGVSAGTVESGKGGELTYTIKIPTQVQGMSRIAIRLESTTGGFFSYNWFYNSTSP
jgi:hypothetical protein